MDFSWRLIFCLCKTRCLLRIKLKNAIIVVLSFAMILIDSISIIIIVCIALIFINIVNLIWIASNFIIVLDLQRREKRRIIKGLLLVHIFHHLFKFFDIIVRLIVHNFYDLCSLLLIDFLDLQIKIRQYWATKSRQTSMNFYKNLILIEKWLNILNSNYFFSYRWSDCSNSFRT